MTVPLESTSVSVRTMQTHPTNPRPAGDDFFDLWLAFRQRDPYDPVCATATRRLYTSIWTLWLRHLSHRAVHWMDASPLDVAQFLKQLKARRAQTDDGRVRLVSEVSQKRYWQLLHWVYDHASKLGHCQHVPTGEMHESDRPRKLNDDPTILDPALWRALPLAFPQTGHCDIYGIRDLVILRLLYEHGLTSEEVRDMRMTDLVWSDSQEPELRGSVTSRVTGAHIRGSRSCQERTIEFSRPLCNAMDHWLTAKALQAKYDAREWVFLSDRANQISVRILFHLVSRTIVSAAQQADLPLPLRCGPQVIRNTVIREKLDQKWPVDKIATFAGLKNRESVWRHAKWNPGQGFS